MVFRFAPNSGGAVIVATEIANNLAKLGHQVTVLTPDLPQSGHRYEPEMNSKVTVIRVETPSKSNPKVAARRCKSNLEKKGKELGKKEKFDFVLSDQNMPMMSGIDFLNLLQKTESFSNKNQSPVVLDDTNKARYEEEIISLLSSTAAFRSTSKLFKYCSLSSFSFLYRSSTIFFWVSISSGV